MITALILPVYPSFLYATTEQAARSAIPPIHGRVSRAISYSRRSTASLPDEESPSFQEGVLQWGEILDNNTILPSWIKIPKKRLLMNYYIFCLTLCYFTLSSIPVSAIEKPKLSDYRKNVYSQFGEDGIIEKIFEVIGTTSKIAVEFGASDGFNCSNTANLWSKNPSWKGILIEADPSLYKQLTSNTAGYANCLAIHSQVGISPQDSIEAILTNWQINETIDVCSIDIDGNDYYILENLNKLQPRLIICEYNPTIPIHVDFYGEYGNQVGSSVAALQRIATQKGYSLIAITDSNCFFVLNKYFPYFEAFDTDPEHIRSDRYIRYIITDYKGNYKVLGGKDFDECWGIHTPIEEKCCGDFTFIPIKITQSGPVSTIK